MTAPRGSIDVRELPITVFGSRHITWWGTFGFVLVETMMFAVAVFTYFYLRRNFEAWPPIGVSTPDLTIPTIGMALLLVSNVGAWLTDRAARRLDRPAIIRALLLQVAFGVIILVLRGFEFLALDVRWDTNAYGSTLWMILGFHTLHLLIDTTESAVMTLIMIRGPEEKHFVDSSEGAMYWYYVSAIWLPLYVVVYLLPRWI